MKPNCLRVASLLVLASVTLNAQVARQETVVPLKTWATPLYWQPNQTEREAARTATPQNGRPQLVFSSNQVSSNALTFIAITPCRLVDTRGGAFNGSSPFSGPSIAPMTTVTFPVQEASGNTAPAPCGTIPSIAQAYSFNLTLVPAGGGRVNYVSMWPSGYPQPFVSTLDDVQGLIVSNAAIVPAGTVNGGISVFNDGPATTDVIIDMNGFFAAPSDLNGNTAIGLGTMASNTTGSQNTATGSGALQNNTTGFQNTAIGLGALENNTTGSLNTAVGSPALTANTTGNNNTAIGVAALANNTTGSSNAASGEGALFNNTSGNMNTATGAGALQNTTTGSNNMAIGAIALGANSTGANNTASGTQALEFNTTGSFNTAIGDGALGINSTGNSNIALGNEAGLDITTGSNNIDIGNLAVSGDSNVVRIGTAGTHTSVYIAGISGVTASGGVEVFINSNGQLGTLTSSRRFKEQITDMGDTSRKLFQLRPVNFFYKPQYDDGSHLLQYGLIAEEVEKVYPEMVAYDNDGQILTVRYQMLAPMLLNEVQKQNTRVEMLEEQNRKLEDRLAALEAVMTRPTSSQ